MLQQFLGICYLNWGQGTYEAEDKKNFHRFSTICLPVWIELEGNDACGVSEAVVTRFCWKEPAAIFRYELMKDIKKEV